MTGVVTIAGPGGLLGAPGRSPLRRLAAGAVVVCIAAYLLGGIAHRSTVAAGPGPLTAQAAAERAGIDLDDVVDVVAHRVTPVPGRAGVLESVDDRYRATFDRSGFALDDFGVSLTSVSHGDVTVPLRLEPWSGQGNVASRQVSTGVTERVTARSGEVEWDVILDRPLPGGGDLVVDARVTGSDGVGVATPSGQGLVFGPSGMHVGALVVKDATGRALYRAAPQATDGGLRLVVPARVLDGAQYPLTIDPTVGSEKRVSNPVPSSAADLQLDPAVAFDGTNFLAVWADGRSGDRSDIYAARVSKTGVVLDATGIAVSSAFEDQLDPAVAFDGTNYLVVWTDYRSDVNSDIYGARVSTAGAVLDASGIAVSTADDDQFQPAVAFDGTNSLVVWTDYRAGPSSDIYGARVSKAGAVLEAAGIAVSTADNGEVEAAVAFDGTTFLAVWTDHRGGEVPDIYGQRLTTAGALQGAAFPVSAANREQTAPEVTFDGTNYLVVWQDLRSGTDSDIYAARVTPAGSVLDTVGLPIAIAADEQTEPSVAFDGTNYLIVWQDLRSGTSSDVYGNRLSPTGTIVDTTGFPISTGAGNQTRAAVGFDGTNFLTLWADGRAGSGTDIFGSRVTKAGEVADAAGIPISTAANDQFEPSVAFDGTNYLVVWADYRGGARSDIYGARVSRTGALLDGAGIAISTAGNDQLEPAVAFDGTNYLVVWVDARSGSSSDIYGSRVSKAGAVLNGAGIAVSTAANDQFAPAVAFDGTNHLVVWADQRSGASTDIYGSRVSKAGGVLNGTGIAVSTAASAQFEPAVASNGTNLLVVWTDFRSGANSNIYGSRVSKAGVVLNGAGIPISTAASAQFEPAVAFDGTNHLVVWTDTRSGTSADVYGARVSKGGVVGDPTGRAISTAPEEQDAPQVAVNGSFLVVWRDRRSGTSDDVYGNRVDGAGAAHDGNGFAIAKSPTDEEHPAVSADPGTEGDFAIVYQRFAPETPYGSHRVFLRTSPK